MSALPCKVGVRQAAGVTAGTTCHSKQLSKLLNASVRARIIRAAFKNTDGEEADLETLISLGWGGPGHWCLLN